MFEQRQFTAVTMLLCAAVLGLTSALTVAAEGEQRAAKPAASNQRAETSDVPRQVALIDQHLVSGWKASELEPSAPATDREFCRRLFLDLLGRIPTVDELEAYARDRDPDKKQRLVDKLLYDELYSVDFATHWSTVWTNTLIGRRRDRGGNNPVSHAGMSKYLRDSFANNKPYDQLVRDLLSAEGTNRPGSPSFNGAVNYLAGKLEDDASLATAHVSRVFLGMQVQCTQCHNHPFNEWKQNQFWQLNSFFRQTTVLRRYRPGTRDIDHFELANEDFAGEDRPSDPENARIYYELRNGKLESAYPVFLDGTSIGTSGLVRDLDRRSRLAKLVAESPFLSKAMVNRTWAHFLGYGFTRPIDDMGPHNIPVYPELLDALAGEFQAADFDMRRLMTWIALSKAYDRSSLANATNEMDDPANGTPPQFSRFYLRQMTAEQLYRSLLTASQADKTQASFAKQQEAQENWLEQFTIAFGTDEGDEATTFDGTITQTLMMFNGDLVGRATAAKPGSFLHHVASDKRQRPAAKLQQLFLAALARSAKPAEQRAFQSLYRYHKQDQLAALQDIWWAVLNSNEFILIH